MARHSIDSLFISSLTLDLTPGFIFELYGGRGSHRTGREAGPLRV